MEQNDNIRTDVSFPPSQPINNSGGGKKKIIWGIILLIIIAVIGAAAWFMLQTPEISDSDASPTPFVGLNTPPSPEPTETATPKSVSKSEVSIEILNGTGVSGEASFLKDKLEKAGFTKNEAGNADSQDKNKETTDVVFSKEMPEDIVKELTELLEGIYKNVSVKSSNLSGDIDVRITTGLRKTVAGASSKASATPTASGTAKASSTAKASTTPTPTATGQ